MRRASLVPSDNDITVYQVLEDFGQLGRAWREIDEAGADERSIIDAILSGEYERPIRVVAFNTVEAWALDVTEDIAAKVLDAAKAQGRALAAPTREFIERATGADVPADL
jgi:hypothetical protein